MTSRDEEFLFYAQKRTETLWFITREGMNFHVMDTRRLILVP
jgi:hypothetical protein